MTITEHINSSSKHVVHFYNINAKLVAWSTALEKLISKSWNTLYFIHADLLLSSQEPGPGRYSAQDEASELPHKLFL
jgi:hypothetical protein